MAVTPKLGKEIPGNLVATPPLGLLGLPISVKESSSGDGGAAEAARLAITSDEIVALCE
ncbi:Uncharacterised protein [Mycobacterium tuberculosis]|uniref:Uncharacterized protein n=1 Tax=Mycobacterium tuberculosis TaxID=1773 RepID=A0A655ANU4_MYCTX|nr:Uncharacterised protein [Mycobacterium tuberculosis]